MDKGKNDDIQQDSPMESPKESVVTLVTFGEIFSNQ
jgi:hypothetical protein